MQSLSDFDPPLASVAPIESDFRIKGIKLIALHIDLSNPLDDTALISYQVRMGTGYAPAEKQITIITEIYFHISSGDDSGTPVGRMGTEITFELSQFNTIVQNNYGLLFAPDVLLERLVEIALSTTRGMLHSRLAGTPLDNTILPLIKPAELMQRYQTMVALPI